MNFFFDKLKFFGITRNQRLWVEMGLTFVEVNFSNFCEFDLKKALNVSQRSNLWFYESPWRKQKVIVTCPSNAAVDVLVEKLAKNKIKARIRNFSKFNSIFRSFRTLIKVTRLGHPARTSHHLRIYTLDAKMSEIEVLRDLKKELKLAKGREKGRVTLNNCIFNKEDKFLI